MSSGTSQEKIDEIFFSFVHVDKQSQVRLLEEINKELEAFLSKENNDTNSTDGIFDFLSQISDSVQETFDEILSGNSDKKKICKGNVKDTRIITQYKSQHSSKN